MPFGTKDIGGGLQTFQYEGAKAQTPAGQLEQAQQYLGLVDLGNRIKQAPLEYAAKQADAILKNNQVDMIDVQNSIVREELRSKEIANGQSEVKFAQEQISMIRNAYREDPELGAAMLSTYMPTAMQTKKADGSIAIAIPGATPFTIYPQGITNPEQKEVALKDRSDRWNKLTEKYQVVYTQANLVRDLLNKGTGEADRSAIYAIAKMQDPTGSVRDNDYKSVQESPNVSQQIKNLLTRATTTEGPVFGELGSPTRTSWNQVVTSTLNNEKAIVEPQAKHFIEHFVEADRLDANHVAVPKGDLTLAAMFPEKYGQKPKDPPAGNPEGKTELLDLARSKQAKAAETVNAGVINPPQTKEIKGSSVTRENVGQAWQQTLKNLLPRGGN